MTDQLSRDDNKRLLGILRNWIKNELRQEGTDYVSLKDFVREELRSAVAESVRGGNMHHEVERIIRNEVSAVLTSTWSKPKLGDRDDSRFRTHIAELVKKEVKAQITQLVSQSMDFEVNVSGKVRRPATKRFLDLEEQTDGE